jgi:1-phosphofructokinase family hexose kinase
MSILTVTLHPAIDKVLRAPTIRPNEVSRCTVEMTHGGGKGNNVARALTRIGVSAIATGYQGGYSGAFITEHIESEGIQTAYVECQEPTRTSTILQVDETGNTYALYEPGQSVSKEEILALKRKFQELLGESKMVLLCGSGQTELLAPVYAHLIDLAKEAGVPALLDSSGEALRLGISAKPFMVKVNRNELSGYFNRSLDNREIQIEAMLELQAAGIDIVALSRGEDGLIATNGKEVWEGILKMDTIVNVVGCGDSQLAGIAKQVVEGSSLKELVRWGVACGTANTQVRGAGRINLDTVLEMLPEVQVVELPCNALG